MASPDTTIVPLEPGSPYTIDGTTVTLNTDGTLSVASPGGMNGDIRTTVVRADQFSMGVDRFQPDGSALRTVYQFEPSAPGAQT